MRRYFLCAGLALVTAIAGPRAVGPRSRAAGAPFVYAPPEGFVEKGASSFHGGGSDPLDAKTLGGMKVWIHDDGTAAEKSELPFGQVRRPTTPDDGPGAVRAVLHHSPKEMSVEEADLAKLAAEMPKAFEESCNWVHRRHELRTLNSGARVGLIEGDCTRDVDFGSLGLPPQKIRARKLQLMFPDDEGTSIVTASYPIDHAAHWEPLFEATIGKARGVATRVPPPPIGTQAAWGAAGAILGWLALGLIKKRGGDTTPSAPA